MKLGQLEISSDGKTVRRNGVVMTKGGMSWDAWASDSQRCGKDYGLKDGNGKTVLYGQQFDIKPVWDENEIAEDGCSGGACTL